MGMSQKRLCMLSSSVSVCFSAVATGWECQDGNVTEAVVHVV